MQKRISEIGGNFTIKSDENETEITILLPKSKVNEK